MGERGKQRLYQHRKEFVTIRCSRADWAALQSSRFLVTERAQAEMGNSLSRIFRVFCIQWETPRSSLSHQPLQLKTTKPRQHSRLLGMPWPFCAVFYCCVSVHISPRISRLLTRHPSNSYSPLGTQLKGRPIWTLQMVCHTLASALVPAAYSAVSLNILL